MGVAMLLITLIQSLAMLVLIVLSGPAWAATDPAELEKFIKARVEIGEMMMNYFRERGVGEKGKPPSQEAMREMQADINTRLTKVLESHGLTIDEYRRRSKDVFADEAAVKQYLEQHPDLKKRYEALPARGGGGSRSYDRP
jgi:hypothetical protein